jgi:hypothetical protein
MTNPAGSAIVNATGAIRQVVHGEDKIQRRYLVIAQGHADKPGAVVQVQLNSQRCRWEPGAMRICYGHCSFRAEVPAHLLRRCRPDPVSGRRRHPIDADGHSSPRSAFPL